MSTTGVALIGGRNRHFGNVYIMSVAEQLNEKCPALYVNELQVNRVVVRRVRWDLDIPHLVEALLSQSSVADEDKSMLSCEH